MPQNHPDIWLRRVIRNISEAIQAPWLNGISEIDANILELGGGSANETNIIYIPATTFKPDVLINNTTYPLAIQAYTDTTLLVSLDKMETKPTSVTDDQVIGAAYDRIDTATRTHVEAIQEKKYSKALHALTPAGNTADTPVLLTTGADDGTGRKRLTYNDLVAASKTAKGPGWRLVLCDDHWNDILLDRQNFGDKLVNYVEGTPAPRIAGFELFNYENAPIITAATKVKKAFGAAKAAGDFYASTFFRTDNVGKKTGLTKQYYSPSVIHPENPVNTLNYRHYFITLPLQNKFIGSIVSAAA